MKYSGYLLLVLLFISFSASAEEYIKSFHSDIEIRANGDLYVTETIVVRAEGQSIRRGIFRDFPTRYRDNRGRDLIVDFEVLSVRRDGISEKYQLKNQPNGKRVYIGDANVFLKPGWYEYQLQYQTSRQLGFFDKFDELYWNVTGNGWALRIDQASAVVSLPAAVPDFQLTGYTGPQGSTAQELTFRRIGEHQVYFETTAGLGRYEGLTIVAGWPKGLISEPDAEQQRRWFIEDNKPSLIAISGAILVFAYYLLVWLRVGRDPAGGTIIPLYQPPQGYSPASMRFIQNMAYDKICFTTAIINLAVKGAVEITEDNGDFKLTRTGSSNAELAPGESQVLAGLFGVARDQIEIVQSNHPVLSRAIGKHKKSLKRDYEIKYFATNGRYLFPAVILTVASIAFAVFNLGSEERIMEAIFTCVFLAIPILMLISGIQGMAMGGKPGLIRTASNFVLLIAFAGVFIGSDFDFWKFSEAVPWGFVAGVIAMLLLNRLFYELLKAPTLVGRKLLDKIEGFKDYLEVAEDDEIIRLKAPAFSTEIYETYLPYAIALDLENAWTAKLNRAIENGIIKRGYSHPRWYHGHTHNASRFSKSLSGSFTSAIASSSVAPGSSSGSSSSGSSGGGGGGGGGGGW